MIEIIDRTAFRETVKGRHAAGNSAEGGIHIRTATGVTPNRCVRIPEEVMRRVELYAADRGISACEAIRRFVAEGVGPKPAEASRTR